MKDPLIQRLIFENLRQPGTIRRTLNQVYIDRTNVDDYLVEAIRKPSLDQGAFRVFRSVFNPGGPPGDPLDVLFEKLTSPVLLLWGNRDPWMNAPGKRQTFLRHAPEVNRRGEREEGGDDDGKHDGDVERHDGEDVVGGVVPDRRDDGLRVQLLPAARERPSCYMERQSNTRE